MHSTMQAGARETITFVETDQIRTQLTIGAEYPEFFCEVSYCDRSRQGF